jgi:outer membrane protein assembly factor BamB
MSILNEIMQKQLPCPIKKSLNIGDLVLVLVDDDKVHHRGDKSLNRNIYAFNAEGILRWQIQEIPGAGNDAVPYVSMHADGDKVFVYNWYGTDYLLDLSDGSVHFYGPPRRPW